MFSGKQSRYQLPCPPFPPRIAFIVSMIVSKMRGYRTSGRINSRDFHTREVEPVRDLGNSYISGRYIRRWSVLIVIQPSG